MGLTKFLLGIALFVLSLFIASALPSILTNFTKSTIELAQIFVFLLGVISIFIGAIEK